MWTHRVGPAVCAIALLIAATLTRAVAEEADPCVLAGSKIGDEFPGALSNDQYTKGSSKILETTFSKALVYRLSRKDKPSAKDFIAIADGHVVAIARYIEIDAVLDYRQALSVRFGEPNPPGFERNDTVNNLELTKTERMTWLVPQCKATFYLIKRTQNFGGLLSQKAVVMATTPEGPGEDLLN